MDKKISSAFALLVITIVGATFLVLEMLNILPIYYQSKFFSGNVVHVTKQQARTDAQKGDASASQCKKRMFEGSAKIHAWLAPDETSDNGIIIAVADDDVDKLPIDRGTDDIGKVGLRVTLVDASDTLLEKLKNASKESPTEISISGFAYSCSKFPMVSLDVPKKAFGNI